jgi:hypothetical protein
VKDSGGRGVGWCPSNRSRLGGGERRRVISSGESPLMHGSAPNATVPSQALFGGLGRPRSEDGTRRRPGGHCKSFTRRRRRRTEA